jgi:arylsulfatase A-like enzyme
MRILTALTILCAPFIAAAQEGGNSLSKPNVLFLAVDDLNDWVGVLGGHPQAKTPNIDRLARQGVLFEQAYCEAPLCNPSRTAIMTGLRSTTTGIHGNASSWFRDNPDFADWVTLPQYFRKHGYMAWTGGKVFHLPSGKFSDPISWDHQYSVVMGTPFPPDEKRFPHGLDGKFNNAYYDDWADWVPLDVPDEETNDWLTAQRAADFLQKDHDKPFFLACGIMRPHLRWYAPQKYFDMHPLEDIQLPPYLENDLDDLPPAGKRKAGTPFGIIKKHGEWKKAIQGYLAASSFADACIGVVLDSLEKSNYMENTVVVLWGDHGYHLGEKNHISKVAMWEEATHTPLIIRAPGISTHNTRSKRTVSLLDIYPTLIELCGLPERDDLDGRSLAPLVKNPEENWPYPAVITQGNDHAVRSERYHYIRYQDGGEELYDDSVDPNGWKNLATDPKYADTIKDLKKWLP